MCAHLGQRPGVRAAEGLEAPLGFPQGGMESGPAKAGISLQCTQVAGVSAPMLPASHGPTWALTSSLACLDQARLHTCEPVSMHCRGWPVSVFQKRMQRSAVPPPEASSPCWCGDQAMAFTAARCSVYCCTGLTVEWFHTSSCGQAEAMTGPPRNRHPGQAPAQANSGVMSSMF